MTAATAREAADPGAHGRKRRSVGRMRGPENASVADGTRTVVETPAVRASFPTEAREADQ